MENITYIYTLTDPRTGSVKYVGKTCQLKERKRYYRSLPKLSISHPTKNVNWCKKLLQLGFEPIFEIVDVVPTEEWKFWEIYWIAQFKAWGFKLKNLCNGGQGPTNYRFSEERKEQCRIGMLGNTHTLGFRHSEETKLNMSITRSGRPYKLKNDKHPSAKIILQIDKLTFEVIAKFECIKFAQEKFNVTHSSISACLRGVSHSSVGFIWIYENVYRNFSKEDLENWKNIYINKERKYTDVLLICNNTSTILKEFSSFKEVCQEFKSRDTTIRNWIMNKKLINDSYLISKIEYEKINK